MQTDHTEKKTAWRVGWHVAGGECDKQAGSPKIFPPYRFIRPPHTLRKTLAINLVNKNDICGKKLYHWVHIEKKFSMV
jgi:hypothetical protein